MKASDGSSPDVYVVHLPAIGETTLEDEITYTKTLPRPEKKHSDQQGAPATSSDPPRRRRLALSDETEQHGQKLNSGYVHDDDDNDVSVHQNADLMFKKVMDEAEKMEREGIDSSMQQLPSPAYQHLPRELAIASHA